MSQEGIQNVNIENFEFQSEAKQVLELMIHSVYSNPDIFLRELISNASDAIDKLRIESLKNDALSELARDGRIDVKISKKAGTVTISDNGIGMSREDLVSYLGTIARSGTMEFVRAVQEAASAGSADLIGQFGIGFYSSFIVSDKVTVITKKAGEDKAWEWTSSGDGTYSIAQGERSANGTDVVLHIRVKEKDKNDGDLSDLPEPPKDYLSEWTLRGIIKRYSDFVSYPIHIEDSEKEKKDEPEEPVNSMKAIWIKPESEVSNEEYNEFYRHITRDFDDPMERIVYKAEGTSEFHALLYIPSRPPMDLFYREGRHGIQLYIRRVFIMNDCRDLIPEYLRFIKGVVDSEDIPLNVSRELLQQDRKTSVIKNGVTRKVLETLRKMKDDHPDVYGKFWGIFGVVLKEGIISDQKNRENIMKLCMFESSEGGRVTLQEYVSSMKDGQKSIYFLAGGSIDSLSSSPKLEAFKSRGINVLLLNDPVDELWAPAAPEFENCGFVSISSEDVEIPGEKGDDGEDELMKKAEASGLAAKLKQAISELGGTASNIEDVRLSSRLVDSPATFVQKGEPISPQMRNLFKAMGQDIPPEKRVLEINPSHPLMGKIMGEAEPDSEKLSQWAALLLGLASIADGVPVENGRDFTKTLLGLLEKQSA